MHRIKRAQNSGRSSKTSGKGISTLLLHRRPHNRSTLLLLLLLNSPRKRDSGRRRRQNRSVRLDVRSGLLLVAEQPGGTAETSAKLVAHVLARFGRWSHRLLGLLLESETSGVGSTGGGCGSLRDRLEGGGWIYDVRDLGLWGWWWWWGLEGDWSLRSRWDGGGWFVGGSEVLLVSEESGSASEGAGEFVDGFGWGRSWTVGWLEVGWWRSWSRWGWLRNRRWRCRLVRLRS